jgi:hypothetical protein
MVSLFRDRESVSFSLLLPGNRPGVATELDTLLLWEQEVACSNPVAPRISLRADWWAIQHFEKES